MLNNTFHFIAGNQGDWKITINKTLTGHPLAEAPFLQILNGLVPNQPTGIWTLTGIISNIRYAEKEELDKLKEVQPDLGRPVAICAALIPIRKSDVWWTMAQDERRKVFEAKSHHTETGLKYLPAIARKLYHCRDIGQPFDFITWFEYAPENAEIFEELVGKLRNSEEWKFVDREIDIRLVKTPQN